MKPESTAAAATPPHRPGRQHYSRELLEFAALIGRRAAEAWRRLDRPATTAELDTTSKSPVKSR